MTTAAPGQAVPVHLAKLNANDDRYLVVAWLVDEGETIEAGTLLLSVETSKAIEEIESPVGGTLTRSAEVGQEYEVGAVLAYVTPATTEGTGE